MIDQQTKSRLCDESRQHKLQNRARRSRDFHALWKLIRNPGVAI